MAIAVACHAGLVTGSGAASAVVTCQGVVESHRIRRKERSKIMAVNTACQGVTGSRRVRRREWSRIMAVIVACRGVQIRRLKFDSGRS